MKQMWFWWKNLIVPNIAIDFKYNTTLNQYVITAVDSNVDISHITLDTNFMVIDTTTITEDYKGDTHDFLALANGHKIISGKQYALMDLSAYTFKGEQGSDSTTVRSTIIQEFDENDSLVYSWDGLDFIHPSEFVDTYKYNVNDFDYSHVNAFDMDVDGNLVVSMRHNDAIYKIDWANKTGAIIWKLGSEDSDFTFFGDTIPFSGQHDIRVLQNGYYSLYDNGNSKANQVSRAMHYELDTVNGTAEAKWAYQHPTNVYGKATGSNHYVSEEYSLVNWGRVLRPAPYLFVSK
ncbi:MAG: hypothetical protein ACJAUV_002301 [Flavobacteriales bacterium]|jgi:hypothetical protein